LSDWLANLNPPQRAAVSFRGSEHCLILAGAGSGKTRVISYRIAFLLSELNIAPYQILAISFTNKAAAEMRERTLQLVENLNLSGEGMTMTTFHAYGARFLRSYGEEVGLNSNFSIYDETEQAKLIKRIITGEGFTLEPSHAKKIASRFSYFKDHGLSESDVQDQAFGREEEQIAELFVRYNRELLSLNAADFGDLIRLPTLALEQNSALQQRLHKRYRVILVDEFQDANTTQLRLLSLLNGANTQLIVVGDDDQAIYTWRGSDPRGILSFAEQFGNCTTFNLEQNYRSTQAILDAASTLIAHNVDRYAKKLWTATKGGEAVKITAHPSDRDEANDVLRTIQSLSHQYALKDFLILVRTNNQTRLFEEWARYFGFKYQIVGGVGFYERAVIKDLVAYLRLLVNPSDFIALERIVNVPRRGIGAKSFETLRAALQTARMNVQSDWENFMAVLDDAATGRLKLGAKARAGCAALHHLYLKAQNMRYDRVSELLQLVVDEIAYAEYLKTTKNEDFNSNWELVSELIHTVDGAVPQTQEAEQDPLLAFLENVALVRPESDQREDSLKIMTIHSAKGLEFPVVFLTGLEEDLLPLSRNEEMNLEEERRLAYVAITRAKERLFLSYAAQRWQYNRNAYALPSRFLSELSQSQDAKIDIASSFEEDNKEYSYVTETGDFASVPQAKHKRWQERQAKNQERRKKRQAQQNHEKSFDNDNFADQFYDDFGDNIEDNFANDMPPELLYFEDAPASFKPGQRVSHARYGTGRVTSVEMTSQGSKVRVDFIGGRERTIMGQFLKPE